MMDKKKMGILLLIIASIAFVLFVVMMQNQFNNPEFENHAHSTSVEAKQTDEHDNKPDENVNIDNEENEQLEETEDEEKEDSNDESDSDSEQTETVEEDRIVNADLLNVRSGPSTDHQISGTLTTGDIVKVYDEGNEWVEIEYEDITGYVNRNFLDPINN